MKFDLYVNGKLEMTCYNNFVAMNNLWSLEQKYGKGNVEVKAVEEQKHGKIKG